MNEFYHPFSIQRTSSLFCLVFCFFSFFSFKQGHKFDIRFFKRGLISCWTNSFTSTLWMWPRARNSYLVGSIH